MPIENRLKIIACALMLFCKFAVSCRAQEEKKVACGALSAREEVLACHLEAARKLLKNKAFGAATKDLQTMRAHTARFPLLEARRLSLLGKAYSAETEFDSCYRYRAAAAALYLEQKQYGHASDAYRDLGVLFIEKADLEKATPYIYKALECADVAGMDSLKIRPYLNLYYIFLQSGNHEKARAYMYKTYRLSKKYRNKKMIAISGVDIAMDYIKMSMLDSARHWVKQMLPDTQGNQSIKACAYYTWALWEGAQGNWRAANTHFYNMKNDPSIQDFYRVFFSEMYANDLRNKKLYKEARVVFEAVLTMARAAGQSDVLHSASKDYYGMLEEMKDYRRAFEVAMLHLSIRDSIYDSQNRTKIAALNIKYETAEKERLLQASKVELAEQTNQRNLLLGGVILIALLGGGIVLRQRYRIQLAAKTHEQETELAKQKLESLRREQSFLSLKSMVAGEEAERNRLAKELHDGLGGMLSNLKLTLTNRRNGNMETHASEVVKMVDHAGAELRRIAQNMMPESLAKFGLVSALEDLCANLECHTKLKTSFQHYGIREPLPQNMILPLYRIVQESLNNVVKHADATEAMVQLVQDDEALHLTIEDNGTGFQPEKALENGGSGLKNLRSRVAFLNGTIEFDSMPGDGTAINVDVPLPTEGLFEKNYNPPEYASIKT
jgi:two-component system, NarL family, sensor kinase